MTNAVAQMSTLELRELIGEVVEEKLLELLRDPDEGLVLQPAVRERLLRQRNAVAAGERGRDFDEVMRELGLG
ncbi:MAG: hypothetical protein HC897_13515 [Thermoanaerobaculia bacterium]|nr:hypothetical protein [Thermoanaerobaculia bacterium]